MTGQNEEIISAFELGNKKLGSLKKKSQLAL
jgi:hypothetical protein